MPSLLHEGIVALVRVPTEYHADAVVLLVDATPVFGVILEAQLGIEAQNAFT